MANYGDQKAAYSLAATASSGMRAPAFARSSRPAFFLLALLWTYLQAVPCGAQGAILVRSSAELAAAFVNQNVSVIYLNDSITVDGNWSETITVTRNVTVRSTEEREAEGVYCLLDFNMRVMLLSLAAGCTLEFRGIEVCILGRTLGQRAVWVRRDCALLWGRPRDAPRTCSSTHTRTL